MHELYACVYCNACDNEHSSNDGDFSIEHAVPGRKVAMEALSVANTNNISGLQPELEGCLLRDVLYAMQGIDRHYVRYDQQTEVRFITYQHIT